MAYDFRITLDDDGFARGTPVELFFDVDGGGLPGDPISNLALQAFIGDQVEDRLGIVTELLEGRQVIDASVLDPLLLGETPPLCIPKPTYANIDWPTPFEQCGVYAQKLSAFVLPGLDALVADGIVQSDDPEADAAALQDTIAQPDIWSCSTTGAMCQFKVPAARLNVYPDAVELVWFDDKDLDSFAFALYAATFAFGDDGPTARRELCRRSHSSQEIGTGDGLVEYFAGHSMAPCEGCEFLHCTECFLYDCLGCGGGVCPACQ